MDAVKRNLLIEQLSNEPEPQLVSIDAFFDGNDDEGSIGCNLEKHPGIAVFRSTFARIAERSDVKAVYAQIAELDPGEGCWPFTDTVFVVGTIPAHDLVEELAALEPDEVVEGRSFGIPSTLPNASSLPVLVAWWD
jgi:hypothetical protein